MRGIFYHPRIPADVREILGYYDSISPRLGNEFWLELQGALEYAREFPERHYFDPSGRRRASLSRFPYHFLFRVFDSYIRITVVRHNKRHPNYGASRN